MATYITMTVDGLYGNSYHAASFEEATTLAEADNYTVIDWSDNNTLVVEG